MNPTSLGAPLTLDEMSRLAVFLYERGHRRAALDLLTRSVVAVVTASHPDTRPTGTGRPA